MEDLCVRIPLVAGMILKNLDNQSLMIYKETSRGIHQYLTEEKLVSIRIIKKYKKSFVQFQNVWEKVLKKASFSNSGINKVTMVKNALLPMSLYSLLCVNEIIRYHLHIVDRSTMCK